MKITYAHMCTIPGYGAKPGFCSRGGRAFCARYGLDWSAFLKQGIEEEALLATGDALAKMLVEHARSVGE